MHRLSILAASAFIAFASWAVPAKRTPFVAVQPDGSEVTLTKVGDERAHYYLTDDDRIAVRHDNAFYFANIDANGGVEPTRLLASDLSARTPSQADILSGIDQVAVRDAITRQAQDSRLNVDRMMAPARVSNTSHIGLMTSRKFPLTGSPRSMVILVEYQDIKFSKSDENTFEYFNGLLNTPGFSQENAIGSALDYFSDNSGGLFTPVFDLFGPITLPQNREYYGKNSSSTGNDVNATRMITDAIDILANQGVDFSPYDTDGNNVVDNVFVFYAGVGEADSYEENSVWPHQYCLRYVYGGSGYKKGSYYFDCYACSNEVFADNVTRDGIGTFCHEFSHVLGLPDLYDTANNGTFTPGAYSILDSGPYNGNSRIPPAYSAFERFALGWIDLDEITEPCDIELVNLLHSNQAYIITTSKVEEFFVLENRQRTINNAKWDRQIPGHGLLIWHINYNSQRWEKNIVNTISTKQYVDLIEACGKTGTSSSILKQYPFPGTGNVKSFDGFDTWLGEKLPFPLTEITETNYIITAKVAGGKPDGIADAIADSPIKVNGRLIEAEMPFDVYDITGRPISCGTKSAQLTAAGVYIVNSQGKAHKIAVK